MINKLFLCFTLSFLSWVFIFNSNLYITINLLILSFISIFIFNFYIYHKSSKNYIIFITLWLIFWLFITTINNIKIQNNQEVINKITTWKHTINWTIIRTYKKDENFNSYIVKLQKIDDKIIENNIFFLLKLGTNSNYEKWNIIEFKDKITIPENQEKFKYKDFLLTNNIYFIANPFVIDKKWSIKLNIIDQNIFNLRKKILFIINDLYPRDEAIFLWWILIWARENLPKELSTNFNNSWLTHLIAVSWFNITIIIIFLSYLLKFSPAVLRVIITTLFIVFFTLIVWDNAAVLRASLIWLIWYYILNLWRSSDTFSVLIATLFVMILFNPLSLNYDISLHLSFLAVLWLLYTQKFFEKIFGFLPKFMAIRESFILTLSAFSFTLPIMIINFWQVSILSPIANLLVWWSIPFAMLFWFLSLIWYIINPIVWIIIWFFARIFLKYVLIMVHFFWSLNYSVLKRDFSEYWSIIEIIYFVILIFCIFYFRKSEK